MPKPILPDLLQPGLALVFCGTAAGRRSAAEGAYYAHPGNLFWRALHAVQLTPRQQQVLGCLSRGLPTKLIARELDLSEHTVKDHIAMLFQALGASNRTEAVIKASQLRLQERFAVPP